MTALRDAAEQAESLAHQTVTAVDKYRYLPPIGGPDPALAADARLLAVATIVRFLDVLTLLGTVADG